MKQLIVRNLDDGTVLALKRRAARNGRSAEAEHRAILRAALNDDDRTSTFKRFLTSMPNVGSDEDFAFDRDLPREPA